MIGEKIGNFNFSWENLNSLRLILFKVWVILKSKNCLLKIYLWDGNVWNFVLNKLF